MRRAKKPLTKDQTIQVMSCLHDLWAEKGLTNKAFYNHHIDKEGNIVSTDRDPAHLYRLMAGTRLLSRKMLVGFLKVLKIEPEELRLEMKERKLNCDFPLGKVPPSSENENIPDERESALRQDPLGNFGQPPRDQSELPQDVAADGASTLTVERANEEPLRGNAPTRIWKIASVAPRKDQVANVTNERSVEATRALHDLSALVSGRAKDGSATHPTLLHPHHDKYIFIIQNKYTKDCIDVDWDRSCNNVYRYEQTGYENQHWLFRLHDSGFWSITSQYAGRRRTVAGDIDVNASGICLSEPDQDCSMEWDLKYLADGSVHIRSVRSNKLLDMPVIKGDNIPSCQLWEWWGSDNQRWFLVPVVSQAGE